jgi:hypothetical protein
MKARVVAAYHGSQDMVQVAALLLDNEGQSLHRQLDSASVRLLKSGQEILSKSIHPNEYNEEEGGYYVFFLHPPVTKYLSVTFDATLYDGQQASVTRDVSVNDTTDPNGMANPVIPMRPAKDYSNSRDYRYDDGKERNPI